MSQVNEVGFAVFPWKSLGSLKSSDQNPSSLTHETENYFDLQNGYFTFLKERSVKLCCKGYCHLQVIRVKGSCCMKMCDRDKGFKIPAAEPQQLLVPLEWSSHNSGCIKCFEDSVTDISTFCSKSVSQLLHLQSTAVNPAVPREG